MPVAPTPRKSSTFTIDSLVGKDSNKGTRESSVSPPARPGDRREPVSLGGMRSGFHPVSPGGGFPPHSLGLKVLGHEASLAHLDSLHHLQQAGVNFGSGHPGLHPLQCGLPPPIAHSSPLPPGLHPSHPGMPPHTQIHPMFMNAAQREGLPFYPWLLSRPGGLLNHRFMGEYCKNTYIHTKHETLNECWGNDGPASHTMDQHYPSTGSTSLVCWAMSYTFYTGKT